MPSDPIYIPVKIVEVPEVHRVIIPAKMTIEEYFAKFFNSFDNAATHLKGRYIQNMGIVLTELEAVAEAGIRALKVKFKGSPIPTPEYWALICCNTDSQVQGLQGRLESIKDQETPVYLSGSISTIGNEVAEASFTTVHGNKVTPISFS